MTTEITLNLPDEVYRRAEHLAQMVNRNVAEVLTQPPASVKKRAGGAGVALEAGGVKRSY